MAQPSISLIKAHQDVLMHEAAHARVVQHARAGHPSARATVLGRVRHALSCRARPFLSTATPSSQGRFLRSGDRLRLVAGPGTLLSGRRDACPSFVAAGQIKPTAVSQHEEPSTRRAPLQ
jgi:hypothetical protein